MNDTQLKYDLVFLLSQPEWDEYQLADHFLTRLSLAFSWDGYVFLTHRTKNIDQPHFISCSYQKKYPLGKGLKGQPDASDPFFWSAQRLAQEDHLFRDFKADMVLQFSEEFLLWVDCSHQNPFDQWANDNLAILVRFFDQIQQRIKNYSKVVEQTQDIVYKIDHKGRFVYVNPAGIQLTGYSLEELKKINFIDLVHSDHRVRFLEEMNFFVEDSKRTKIYLEFPILTPSGKEWLSVNLIKTDHKGHHSYLALGRNITRQKDTTYRLTVKEQQSYEVRRFYEDILNSLPSDIVVFDKEHRYLFVNPVAIADPETRSWLVGKTDYDYVKLRNKPIHIADNRRALFNRVVNEKREQSIIEKIYDNEGQIEYHQRRMFPILDQEGKVNLVVGYGLNITELKRAEEELQGAKEIAERSLQTKERFLANMSHEIRTPMNAIVGLSRMLSKTTLDDQQKSFLDAIVTSSENLMLIISDILEISKIEARDLELEEIGFSLSTRVTQMIDSIRFRAEEKGLTLDYKIDPKLPEYLKGDPVRINKILLNLLNNGIKFTEKGFVHLEVTLEGKENDLYLIKFAVSDSGIGIPEEEQDLIFDIFHQEDSTTTRKFGGTGLGLSISKQLAELMDSEIRLQSEKDKGSVFYFTLKLPASSWEEIQETKSVRIASDALKGIQLLIVEDNAINQFVALNLMGQYGPQIVMANNGKEAIEMLNAHDFDAILMDIQMPIMNGIQATEYIRNEMNLNIPIIALTANGFKEDVDKFMAAGMDGFIIKPFDPERATEKILQLLNKEVKKVSIETLAPQTKKLELSQGNSAYFSLHKFRSFCNNNKDFMLRMIDLFIAENTENLKKVKQCTQEENRQKLSRAAHAMKAPMDLMGVDKAYTLARQLEYNDNIPKENIEEKVMELEGILANVFEELRKEKERLQQS